MKNQEGRRNSRVILVPCPLQGHICPMLQLGTLLYSQGFSITVAHIKFNAPDPLKHPNFTFLPLDADLTEFDTSRMKLQGLMKTINSRCEPLLRKYLQAKMKSEPHDEVVCIVYDTIMHYGESVAQSLQISSIVLQTTNALALLAYFAIPSLVEQGNIPVKESLMYEIVPNLYPLRYYDIPIHNGDLEGLLRLIPIVGNIKSSSAIIWNTIKHLESSSLDQLQQHYSQVPLFSIGPLNVMTSFSSTSVIEEDSSCKPWLDKKSPNSVIYVSLGSLATLDKDELTEMAWGLANSGQFVLWVVRPGLINGLEWIDLLPVGFNETAGDRIFITKWAPQKEVLAHNAVGGFWSHCGWNSTLESVSEGVPLICKPFSGDQYVNTRYLTQVWKVGIEYGDAYERVKIAKTIKTLMVDKEGDEMRRRANELKETMKKCTMEGGSSHSSLNELVQLISSFKKPK